MFTGSDVGQNAPSMKLFLLREENKNLRRKVRNNEEGEIEFLEEDNKELREAAAKEKEDTVLPNIAELIAKADDVRIIEKRGKE